jgi:hypothetical protein
MSKRYLQSRDDIAVFISLTAAVSILEPISKLTIDVSNEREHRTLSGRHAHFQPNSIFCHACGYGVQDRLPRKSILR